MSSGFVLAAYGCAAILPLALLYVFGARAWYWHALSICLAVALGLAPTPAEWRGPGTDLVIGSAFTLLFVWSVAAPLFHIRHHHPHSRLN